MGSQSHRENKTKTRFQHQLSWTRIIDTDFFCLVFSMVLDTHWSWNCFFSLWFWLPIGPEIFVFLFCFIFSIVFAIPYSISAVHFLCFLRGCLTECSLHAHGMSFGMCNGMLPGCFDTHLYQTKKHKQHNSNHILCLHGHLGLWFAILQSTKQTININNWR